MHVAAPDSGIIDAAGVQAGRLQRNGLAVGSGPDNGILRIGVRGEGAEQQRGENGKVPHSRSICWVMGYPSEFVEGRITKVPNARNDERMSAGDW